MTELSPVSHKSRLARMEETPPGSVGALIPNTEARLVDPETGEDVPEGEEGEIWVRGPQVMRGYLNNPAATAETLVEDGWLRTGDIGRVDENGFFFIVDRLKELIKYKGYQVPPAELEAVLVSHPKVKDAGVIGMQTEDGEEAPMALRRRRGGRRGRRAPRVRGRASRSVQEAAPHRVRRRGAEVGLRQDPPPRAARAVGRCEDRRLLDPLRLRDTAGRANRQNCAVNDLQILLAALFISAALLNSIANWLKVPYPIPLVIGGLILGLIPGMPDVRLDPDLVLLDLPAAAALLVSVLLRPARAAGRRPGHRSELHRVDAGDGGGRRGGGP